MKIPIECLFWERAVRDELGCLVWQRPLNADGYGQMHYDGQGRYAHQVAYLLTHGELPAGLQIDHLCRNKACIEPSHLEAVTPRENTLRGISPSAVNATKTHCKRGHPFDEENTGYKPNGARVCKECRAVSARKYYYRKGRERRRQRTGATARTDHIPASLLERYGEG